jgi:hypothetical protein
VHLRDPRGKLLEYIVTECIIEANPDKISAIADIGQVMNVKDVLQLKGCLVALSHFVSQQGRVWAPPLHVVKEV